MFGVCEKWESEAGQWDSLQSALSGPISDQSAKAPINPLFVELNPPAAHQPIWPLFRSSWGGIYSFQQPVLSTVAQAEVSHWQFAPNRFVSGRSLRLKPRRTQPQVRAWGCRWLRTAGGRRRLDFHPHGHSWDSGTTGKMALCRGVGRERCQTRSWKSQRSPGTCKNQLYVHPASTGLIRNNNIQRTITVKGAQNLISPGFKRQNENKWYNSAQSQAQPRQSQGLQRKRHKT